MKEFSVLFYGHSICYRSGGSGGTLVLLHGFTEMQDIWNDFASELSAKYRVITMDLPGHGKSDCIGEVHSMELMASCVKHVLDHTGVNDCVMIGHSMGGYVTLAFAEKYPERIKGFGLFHSSALADSDEARENRGRAVELIRKNYTSFISAFIPDLFAPHNQEIYKKEIEGMVKAAKNMRPASIIAAQEGMKIRPDRTKVLADSQCPVLFILGKLDSRVPFEKVLQQAGMPNDAVVLTMGDVAHMGYIEARDKTLYAVRAFLEGIY
jgi:pimeloyl-ACP methyl ester carboxylesterase